MTGGRAGSTLIPAVVTKKNEDRPKMKNEGKEMKRRASGGNRLGKGTDETENLTKVKGRQRRETRGFGGTGDPGPTTLRKTLAGGAQKERGAKIRGKKERSSYKKKVKRRLGGARKGGNIKGRHDQREKTHIKGEGWETKKKKNIRKEKWRVSKEKKKGESKPEGRKGECRSLQRTAMLVEEKRGRTGRSERPGKKMVSKRGRTARRGHERGAISQECKIILYK